MSAVQHSKPVVRAVPEHSRAAAAPARNPRLAFRRFRGGMTLEMVLVLPIMVMLGFGTVEYGYAMYLKNTLQGAAYEAARVAIQPSGTNTNTKAAADQVVTAAFPTLTSKSSYQVTTVPGNVVVASGSWIQVTVECDWGAVGVHPLPTIMGGIDTAKKMRATMTMRKE